MLKKFSASWIEDNTFLMNRVLVLLFLVTCFLISCQVDFSYSQEIQQGNLYPPSSESGLITDSYYQARVRMVEDTIVARGISDDRVIQAMSVVPRHKFIPDQYHKLSYSDDPLPIGYGQTISQPYIVAWMTELLELEPGDKVLEIGTGSGYQAAILAEIGELDIYSVEIVPELYTRAEKVLAQLGYKEVKLKQGDGYFGWEEYAPYDAIIVTAAPDHLPSKLVEQLADTGRIIIPIGPPGNIQTLWKFVVEDGSLIGYNLGSVRFVTFTGKAQEGSASEP